MTLRDLIEKENSEDQLPQLNDSAQNQTVQKNRIITINDIDRKADSDNQTLFGVKALELTNDFRK